MLARTGEGEGGAPFPASSLLFERETGGYLARADQRRVPCVIPAKQLARSVSASSRLDAIFSSSARKTLQLQELTPKAVS